MISFRKYFDHGRKTTHKSGIIQVGVATVNSEDFMFGPYLIVFIWFALIPSSASRSHTGHPFQHNPQNSLSLIASDNIIVTIEPTTIYFIY